MVVLFDPILNQAYLQEFENLAIEQKVNDFTSIPIKTKGTIQEFKNC